LNKTFTSQEACSEGSNLERAFSQCCPNIRSFEGKGHSPDNTVKALLTFCAPRIRQMETSSFIATITVTTALKPINTETETHRNFRLAFGEIQKFPKLKLRNKF
jgi:hypothetical protein